MNLRRLLLFALFLVPLAAPRVALAEEPGITIEEFKLWRDYRDAMEDERVQKLPEGKRMAAIAKNFKVTEKKLAAAVAKGEAVGESVAGKSEQAIRAALEGTGLEPSLREVRIDASSAHVVAYLHWAAAKPEKIDQEAALLAVRAAKAAPLTSTISVLATDPRDDKNRLFEALITSEAAGRINESRIVDFASSRYIKLFEKVQRAE